MPTSEQPGGSSGTLAGRVVRYVATGLEGTSFLVPIGATMPSADYAITWAPDNVANVPIPAFPNGVGDRSSTYFRVQTADVLTLGDVLTFVLFG